MQVHAIQKEQKCHKATFKQWLTNNVQFVGVPEMLNRLWLAARVFFLLLIFCFLVAQGIKAMGFRINDTSSMPRGIYHFNTASPTDKIENGSTVLIAQDTTNAVYMMGVHRGYDPFGVDLIKEVIGVEGDRVTVKNHVVTVCQRNPLSQNKGRECYKLPCLQRDNKGLPLNCTAFEGIIPEGKVFVYGKSSNLSFDSRYFGLVDKQYIKGVGSLLWQW
jgi:conjugative transfer signal peptidase TraF